MAEQKTSERISLGNNVTAMTQGSKLLIIVDMAGKGTLSKEGKAVIKASTPVRNSLDESQVERLDCAAWLPVGSFINVMVGTPKRLIRDEESDGSKDDRIAKLEAMLMALVEKSNPKALEEIKEVAKGLKSKVSKGQRVEDN